MIATMLVVEEGDVTYRTKNGEVTDYRAAMVDMTEGNRCALSSFQMTLSKEQKDRFAGKLKDTTIKVGITALRAGFDGVMGFTGNILETGTNGKSTPASK